MKQVGVRARDVHDEDQNWIVKVVDKRGLVARTEFFRKKLNQEPELVKIKFNKPGYCGEDTPDDIKTDDALDWEQEVYNKFGHAWRDIHYTTFDQIWHIQTEKQLLIKIRKGVGA